MKTTLPFLALTALLGACSGNANTPPAEATAPSTTMADTNVGEQFLEANVKEDSVKLKSLLADDVLVIGNSPKQRASGKDTVANMMARTFPVTNNFKFNPLAKRGDADLVYYSGFYTQNVEPNARYKKGGIDAGSYTMIARKDRKNDWKISYFHSASAPFQPTK